MSPNPKSTEQVATTRAHIPPVTDFGITLDPDVENLLWDSTALARAYGGASLSEIFSSRLTSLCVITACVGGLLFGFDQGLLSIILVMPKFLSDFPDVDTAVSSSAGFNKGIMTAMLELGAFLGAIFVGFVADKYSRKVSIGVGLAWFAVGSTIQTSSFSLAQLIVGRTLGGIGIGMLSCTAPIYVSEIAPPNVRGALLVMEQFMIVFGIVVMFYITYGTRIIESAWCYRLPFLLQMVPGFFLAGMLFILPYSPRWLASQGRDQECLDTLCRLRGLPPTDARVQAEWLSIRVEAIHNREALLERHPTLTEKGFATEVKLEMASWVDMFKPAVIRRTMIGIALMFFQQFVGINALIYYSPTLFETLGLDSSLQLHMSGVMNILQMVAVIAAFFVFDRIGRRPLLLIGSIGMCASHVIVAIMIGLYSKDWANHSGQAWVGVTFILFYMVAFGLSWGPVPWAMPAEVHSSSYRAKGVALSTCSNWLNNFIIGLVTPPMIQHIGYGTFIFFAAFSFLSGIWAWFIAPETKGRTLEQMDLVFHSHTAAHDWEMKAQITRLAIGQSAESRSGPEYENKASKEEFIESK
ncbi:hypothetical protein EHS25_007264 [Saitozyma podzolica]|uniref:Major facilitator superfamily (MFS) profile domain-containing protein n=1 Tax=Saitozyma podzolica TaxID=1890683 RepID=A0A427XML3_9TREE|nr:hypothetical protein EHS25_007264 [Saitozyma podzolica]